MSGGYLNAPSNAAHCALVISNRDTRTDPNADTSAYSNADADANPHTYSDTHAHANPDADARTDSRCADNGALLG